MDSESSDWKRISSIRELYEDVVEVFGPGSKKFIPWEAFKADVKGITRGEVPVEYSDYDVSVTSNGKIIESYGEFNPHNHTLQIEIMDKDS